MIEQRQKISNFFALTWLIFAGLVTYTLIIQSNALLKQLALLCHLIEPGYGTAFYRIDLEGVWLLRNLCYFLP